MANTKKPVAQKKEKAADTKKVETVKVAGKESPRYDSSLEAKQEAIRKAAQKRAATQGENPTNLPDLAPGAYMVKKLSFINGSLVEAGEVTQLEEGVEPGKFLAPLGDNPTPNKIAKVRNTEDLEIEETTPASRRGQLEQEQRGGINLDELENRREVQETL